MKRFFTPSQARFGMALASLIGLFASAYLLYTYVTGSPIACGLVKGCEVVRASKWATTFFDLPRPLLGVIFYVAVFALLVIRSTMSWNARFFYRLTMLFAAVGFVESGILFVIQWVDLKAFCQWCLISGLASTFVAIFAFFDREGPAVEQGQKELRRIFLSLLVFLPVSVLGFYLLTRPVTSSSSILPTIQDPNESSIPAVEDVLLTPETPTIGAVSSSVLVVEFLDFECTACRAFHPTMKQIRQEYVDRVRFAVRQFPLWELHPRAKEAGIAAECARRQGRFFPYADVLYEKQTDLSQASLLKIATEVGLNESRFRFCLADPDAVRFIEAERADAVRLRLQFTPTIFVNRIKIDRALPYEELKTVIDQELAKEN